jgi:hypothetical protein
MTSTLAGCVNAGEPVPGNAETLPSGDGRVCGEESQAAELLAELDDGFEPDAEEVEDVEEPDELVEADEEELDEDFDAGLLLDEEPRLSLR